MKDMLNKEGSRIVPLVSNFLSDGSSETRLYGKRCCHVMLTSYGTSKSVELENTLLKFVSESKAKQMIEAADKYRDPSKSGPSTPNSKRSSIILPTSPNPLGGSLGRDSHLLPREAAVNSISF
jgi:hypothetical protein